MYISHLASKRYTHSGTHSGTNSQSYNINSGGFDLKILLVLLVNPIGIILLFPLLQV